MLPVRVRPERAPRDDAQRRNQAQQPGRTERSGRKRGRGQRIVGRVGQQHLHVGQRADCESCFAAGEIVAPVQQDLAQEPRAGAPPPATRPLEPRSQTRSRERAPRVASPDRVGARGAPGSDRSPLCGRGTPCRAGASHLRPCSRAACPFASNNSTSWRRASAYAAPRPATPVPMIAIFTSTEMRLTLVHWMTDHV